METREIVTPYFTKQSEILDSFLTDNFMATIEGSLEFEHGIFNQDTEYYWLYTTDTVSNLAYIESKDGTVITFYCRPCLDIENTEWLCYQIVLQVYPSDHPNHQDYSWTYHPQHRYYLIGLGDADFMLNKPNLSV
jgi:hypothetical protein